MMPPVEPCPDCRRYGPTHPDWRQWSSGRPFRSTTLICPGTTYGTTQPKETSPTSEVSVRS